MPKSDTRLLNYIFYTSNQYNSSLQKVGVFISTDNFTEPSTFSSMTVDLHREKDKKLLLPLFMK